MNLSETIKKAIDEIIHNYIQTIATKYDLDPNELIIEWEGKTGKTGKTVKTVTISPITNILDATAVDNIVTEDIDYDNLSKYKKTEIQTFCRQKGVKCSGTKEELINLLIGSSGSSSTPKPKAKPKTSSTVKEVEKAPAIIVQLQSKIQNITIRRNQFGNHEHAETSFIFDKKTKNVIGKQNKNGTIDVLTKHDIEICNKMKFIFDLPKNLDNKSTFSHEKVDELDEEFEEDDDEILEEELDEEDLIEDDEEAEEDDQEDFEEDYE